MTDWKTLLAEFEFEICKEAKEWIANAPADSQEAWDACPRGDWLLYLARRFGVASAKIVEVECEIVDGLGLPQSEYRILEVIAAARAWSKGTAFSNHRMLTDEDFYDVARTVLRDVASVPAVVAGYRAAAFSVFASMRPRGLKDEEAEARIEAQHKLVADLVRARITSIDFPGGSHFDWDAMRYSQ